MSFDWNEFLLVAQELSAVAPTSPPSDEARQRSAISRAYYAAFHACLAKLGSKVPSYQNSHIAVVEYFLHNQNRAYKDIGMRLNMLLLDRRNADYERDVPRIGWLVHKAIANAEDILAESVASDFGTSTGRCG